MTFAKNLTVFHTIDYMHRFLSSFIFLFVLICRVAFFSSCKKDSSTPGNANPDLATVSTDRVEAITTNSALVVSTVSKEGKSAVTGMGIAYGKNPNPTVVADNNIPYASFGVGTFNTQLSNLESGTTYYVRAYATNSSGTAYGNQVSFSTINIVLATLSTTTASDITSTAAISGGNITTDGGSSITDRGVCWSTSENPTIALTTKTSEGIGTGSFTSNISGLSPGTTYYVRAYATNSAGTAYGNQQTLTTLTQNLFNPNLTYGTMSDNDGNSYKTIVIGSQTWMAENLKTGKYRNGDPIPTNLSNTAWQTATTGAFAIYNNDAASNTTYGKLYNWYAVADPRGLCPTGWHVPTDAELTILQNYLGGINIAGGKLKSTSSLWTPNTGATNESGFSGLPGGNRSNNGFYSSLGYYGYWWSSSEFLEADAWSRGLITNNGIFYRTKYYRQNGFSIRCLRD